MGSRASSAVANLCRCAAATLTIGALALPLGGCASWAEDLAAFFRGESERKVVVVPPTAEPAENERNFAPPSAAAEAETPAPVASREIAATLDAGLRRGQFTELFGAGNARAETSGEKTPPAAKPPAVKPAAKPALPATAKTDSAPTAPPANLAGGGIFVQLASMRTSAEAEQALSGARQRFAALLRAHDGRIQRAVLEARGIFFRVQIGPFASLAAANGLCRELKSARQDCILHVERAAALSDAAPRFTRPGLPGESASALAALDEDAEGGAD
jgi:hypothetical protein